MEPVIRARLLIINPDLSKNPPRLPSLILEDGAIGVYHNLVYQRAVQKRLYYMMKKRLARKIAIVFTDYPLA